MSFFESEVVRAELAEVQELQEEVYSSVFKFPSMDTEEKLRHIDLLEKLIDKQKIVWTRLSLSDDPSAIEMKQNMIESARAMGLPANVDMSVVFNNMNEMLNIMKNQVDSMGSDL